MIFVYLEVITFSFVGINFVIFLKPRLRPSVFFILLIIICTLINKKE